MPETNNHAIVSTAQHVDKREEIGPVTRQIESDGQERKQMLAYVDFVESQAEKASNQLKAEIEKERYGGKGT